MRIGYAVASGEQLESQRQALYAAGCHEIFIGNSRRGSGELRRVVERLEAGDALLVANSRILGLSPTEIEELIWDLGYRQVALLSLEVARILEISIDTLYRWSAAYASTTPPIQHPGFPGHAAAPPPPDTEFDRSGLGIPSSATARGDEDWHANWLSWLL